MNRYAVAALLRAPARLALSVGGVALALALVLALDAIVTGTEARITTYIDRSGADVWVAQSGVRTMHMSASTIPLTTADDVARIDGVASVTPIRYLATMVVIGNDRVGSYVIGLPPDAAAGRLWNVTGAPMPPPGGVIIDDGVARNAGVGIGDRVSIMGGDFTIAGLSRGTANMVTSVAVIPADDFARLRGDAASAAYLLVRADDGVDAEQLANRIQSVVPGVTALTRTAFAAQERALVRDMSSDLVTIMNSIALVIGLAVMTLTTYTGVTSRRQEYGVLKAIGARNSHLYGTVILQSLLAIAAGLAISLAVTLLIAAVVPRLATNLTLIFSAVSVLRVAAMSIGLVLAAAILPIRQLAALDPAMVFRRAT